MSDAAATTDSAAHWRAELNAARAAAPLRSIDRVIVLDDVASTQDAAMEHSAGRPGLLLTTLRQTSGRGRLGRSWHDGAGLGIAATFVLDAAVADDATFSLAAGLAALRACEDARAGVAQTPVLGLRWPNDVVERGPAGRKIAGVLIERRAAVVLVGVGINTLQRDSDWPTDLRTRAASLHQLGARSLGRPALLWTLTRHLDACLALPPNALSAAWRERDVLRGTRRAFLHNAVRHEGLVVDIDPLAHIVLRRDDAGETRLPALSTSLIHEP